MIKISLPVSKYVVEIRESITYGEYMELDNFYQNRAQNETIDGKSKVTIGGGVIQEFADKLAQTFLHSCRAGDDSNAEISTIGLMKTLDVRDGKKLFATIEKQYEEIKKNLD